MSRKRKAGEAFHNGSKAGETNSHGRLKDRARALLSARQTLPIWAHRDEIRHKVHSTNVVLLVGETGSGKSTQVPQFLSNEKWCSKTAVSVEKSKNINVGGCIAIVQPRRVAAISLAQRVAEEIGTPLGSSSPASTVGYSVRFDHSTSPSTKIKFLTDGMLLQEMLRDPYLREYSCVIVDEVHERGVNVDLTLGFLKKLVAESHEDDGRAGIPLKVVIMSATADMEKVMEFFSRGSTPESNHESMQNANGARGKAQNERVIEWNGFSDDEEKTAEQQSGKTAQLTVSSCFIKGRQYPVQISYTPRVVDNILDAAMERIIYLHTSTPIPGDILVFLSGQEMIENLESLCNTYSSTITQQKESAKKYEKLPTLQILPLFAALPTQLQQRVFQPTPNFTRKIILSTDIAETSVTVSGVRHVIDTGKHKSRHFRPGLNLDTLLTGPISRSSAAQRAGRAGREAPGTCYRLFTQDEFYKLEQDTPPEILQTDLSFLMLTLKSHGVDDVLQFPLLTPPPRKSLESAIIHLLQLNALDADTGRITDIGRKMSMLPLRADLGRILLESTLPQYGCVDEIIDIVAGLSLEEGIWLPLHNRRNNTEQQQNGATNHVQQQQQQQNKSNNLLLSNKLRADEEATTHPSDSDDDEESSNPVLAARRTLFRREGDHLTLLAAIQSYSSPSTHDRREWCNAHGVSHRAMSRIMDVRKQLHKMVKDDPRGRFRLGDGIKSEAPNASTIERSTQRDNFSHSAIDLSTRILKCLLTGLWPNIATLTSTSAGTITAPYTTLLTRQPLHIHPSSFLFNHASVSGSNMFRHKKKGGGSRSSTSSEQQQQQYRPPIAPTIMFTDFIYTAKPYARNVSLIEMKWMDELGIS